MNPRNFPGIFFRIFPADFRKFRTRRFFAGKICVLISADLRDKISIQLDLPFSIQSFTFGHTSCQLCVPDENAVKEMYQRQQQEGYQPEFPYWAKLWPASIALCNYLAHHSFILKDKTVLELAAGLGLPSLLASAFAKKVICSDYLQPALDMASHAAAVNDIKNMECRLIDWSNYPADLETDVVLLSDINYDPKQFEILLQLIKSLLNKGTIVILSTPQRMMGKPFIAALLPYCTAKQTGCVEVGNSKTEIFIMQLEKAT